jgi:glycerate kinase
MGKNASDIYGYGVEAILTTINAAMPIGEAMDRAEELFGDAAERLFRMIRVGRQIH